MLPSLLFGWTARDGINLANDGLGPARVTKFESLRRLSRLVADRELSGSAAEEFEDAVRRLGFRIEYESLYDEQAAGRLPARIR
jgi:hypothetical protein